MSEQTCAVVYLFDSSAEGVSSWYGSEFDPAFLAAFGSADPNGESASSVLRGDAILSHLATKVSAVTGAKNRSGHTVSHDMELYKTLIWDLVDAFGDQWNSLNLEEFPQKFAQQALHCICLPTVSANVSEETNQNLSGTRGYLGALEIDVGSPIQTKIFFDYLISDAIIRDGQVVMELGWEGHRDSTFVGAEDFLPRGERWVPNGDLAQLRPITPKAKEISVRGQISLDRYQGKINLTLQDRVASGLSRISSSLSQAPDFSIAVNNDPANPLEAELPEAKFLRYLLDPKHKHGASKAKFFQDVLGIGVQDWRYLAAQLHDGLKSVPLDEIKIKTFESGFGVSFNATMNIAGINGRSATVETNWIFEPGRQPRLSTVYPAKAPSRIEGDAKVPAIVPQDLQGDDRWSAIYDLAVQAGRDAAAATVPTPMKVQGYAVIMDGLCGFAWVRVPDARRGFAKWVIGAGHAYRHYKAGAQIFAERDTQSIDKAVAYATAFAKVLLQNGVECQVDSMLD